MDRIAAMTAFAAVVEAGSFAQAAQRRNWSTSSLSRLVAALEAHLGARLLNRTTRKLSLTESGQAYYEHCVQLLAEIDEAEAIAGQAAVAPRGRIRMTCSLLIGVPVIAPAIASFCARHPAVRFDVTLANQRLDLVEQGFDLAVRIGSVGAESLVARRLGEMSVTCAAAPEYLRRHGTPGTPADLVQHQCVTYAAMATPGQWSFTDRSGARHDVRVSGPLHADDGEFLAAAAAAGLGIVIEPEYTVRGLIERGQLVRILADYNGPRAEIWAVYPSRRHLSAKVRLFVDHLAATFAAPVSASAAPGARKKRTEGTKRAKRRRRT